MRFSLPLPSETGRLRVRRLQCHPVAVAMEGACLTEHLVLGEATGAGEHNLVAGVVDARGADQRLLTCIFSMQRWPSEVRCRTSFSPQTGIIGRLPAMNLGASWLPTDGVVGCCGALASQLTFSDALSRLSTSAFLMSNLNTASTRAPARFFMPRPPSCPAQVWLPLTMRVESDKAPSPKLERILEFPPLIMSTTKSLTAS